MLERLIDSARKAGRNYLLSASLVASTLFTTACGGGGGGGALPPGPTPPTSPAAPYQQPVNNTTSPVYSTTPANLTPAQITLMNNFVTAFQTSSAYTSPTLPANFTQDLDAVPNNNVGSLLDIVLSLIALAPNNQGTNNGTTDLNAIPNANLSTLQFALLDDSDPVRGDIFAQAFDYHRQRGEIAANQIVNVAPAGTLLLMPLDFDYFWAPNNVLCVRKDKAYKVIQYTLAGLAARDGTNHVASVVGNPPYFITAFNSALPAGIVAATAELSKRRAFVSWCIPNSMENFFPPPGSPGLYASLVYRTPLSIDQAKDNVHAAHRFNHRNTSIINEHNDRGLYFNEPSPVGGEPDIDGLRNATSTRIVSSYFTLQYTGDDAWTLEDSLSQIRSGPAPAVQNPTVDAFEDKDIGFNVDYIEN